MLVVLNKILIEHLIACPRRAVHHRRARLAAGRLHIGLAGCIVQARIGMAGVSALLLMPIAGEQSVSKTELDYD